MSPVVFNPSRPDGFILAEPKTVADKLSRFAAVGPSKIYLLFDFDRTLTSSRHNGHDSTTWQIMHGLLPEEGKKLSQATRKKYLALEAAGLLSEKDTSTWSISELDLHSTHGTNIRQVERAAKRIHLRDGAEALFKACEAAGIPTVILSAGVRDVIEVIVREHHIHPSVILSIKLVVAPDGRVTGWHRGSMIHTHNKRERGNSELALLREERPYTIVIGDSVEDANMAEGDHDVLRIRICDSFKEDTDNPASYLQQSFKAGYDAVVEGDLDPIVNLMRWLKKTSGPTGRLPSVK